MELYHFTDEAAVQGMRNEGLIGFEGRSSFYSIWPPYDLMPQGSSDCTWVVIVDVPDEKVDTDRFNADICTVRDDVLINYRENFRYEPISPEQRARWGFR
jgi:hypothetical protein